MPGIDVMLWSDNENESVRASKIRNFGIYPEQGTPPKNNRFKLLGWYNKDEYFYFGSWDTDWEARAFLHGLHRQMEGR